MSKHRLRRPSPALVISIIALVMAMGGVGYAAGGSDTKADKKIAKNYFNNHIGAASVSHASTADSATTASTASTASSANSLNGVVIVKSPDQTNFAGSQDSFTEPCPAGMNVIGGGSHSSSGNTLVNINTSLPARTGGSTEPNGWRIDENNGSGSDTTFNVYAVCVHATVTSNYTGASSLRK